MRSPPHATSSPHVFPRWVVDAVTGARGVAGMVVVALLLGAGANRAAFWVFLVAILSDLVDGRLARMAPPHPRGAWLDPLADKLLTDPTWIALWIVGWAPGWLVAASLLRDVLAGWLWWRGVRGVSPAAQVGIAYEGVALCVLLFHGPWLGVHWTSVGTVLGGIALGLFLASLPQYWMESRP
ncbi:MAG: CDP-alcohol phosphatidyltransferase family protein [Myxococcales bacterium]|nr:CDP-alcohol phosphatidyltransferase family protein [Myxococcales bacterium]